MPETVSSPSAVIVSGGKQYRVKPGDRILVDRMAAEPGASVKLGDVLLLTDGADIKVGAPAVAGVEVEAKVIGHERGPRIESIRYKPKKRVRVHRGGRAHLTALEIIAVGGAATRKDQASEVAVRRPEVAPEEPAEASKAQAARRPRRTGKETG